MTSTISTDTTAAPAISDALLEEVLRDSLYGEQLRARYLQMQHDLTTRAYRIAELDETAASRAARIGEQDADIASKRRVIEDLETFTSRQAAAIRVYSSQLAEHEQWKHTLVEDAHRMADRQSYCSEFDDFMEAHDLPRRTADYTVTRTFTRTCTVTESCTVTARDEADAVENAQGGGYYWSNQETDNEQDDYDDVEYEAETA